MNRPSAAESEHPRLVIPLPATLPLSAVAVSVAFATALIAANERSGLLRTIALLWVVAAVLSVLIFRTSAWLEDRRVLWLLHAFAAKLALTFIILYAGWAPGLDPSLPSFGYDPQRYYFEAEMLRDASFNPRAVPNLNYTAILFVYGGIFALFGHNPAAPALVNLLATVFATIVVVRAGYGLVWKPGRHAWVLGLAMLIPDVLWFDTMTSRETLTMAFVTLGVLGVASSFVPALRNGMVGPLGGILALFSVGVLRTALLLPAVAAIVIAYFATELPVRRRIAGFIALLVVVLLFAVAARFAERLGSYAFVLRDVLDIRERARYTMQEGELQWTDRSLGRLLVTESPAGIIAFAPLRVVTYLVAPLPGARVSPAGLLRRDWYSWQIALMSASSLLYIITLPNAVASAIQSLRRKRRSEVVVHSALWMLLLAAAVGNQIIHERYRLTAILFYWAAAWLGMYAGKRMLLAVRAAWGCLIAVAAVGYIAFKFVL